jgi:hypothetical protein
MNDDLEALREIFKDARLHIGIGVITQVGIAPSGADFRAQVKLLPEEREVVCIMTWEDVGQITLPQVNDLVLCAFVDGHPDEAFVIRRLTNTDQLIPTFAKSGHTVNYSRAGKKLYLGSDTKIGLGRPNVEPAEPLVLGNVMKTFLDNFLNAILNASQIGFCSVGPVYLDPTIRTNLVNYKSTYVDTAATNILSQNVFTERGV